MAGRPSLYSREIALQICEQIATSSNGLKTILDANDSFPSQSTFFNWLNDKDKPELLEMYTRAREEQAEYMVDEILSIADDGENDFMTVVKGDVSYTVENKEWTSRSKLRVEARKWVAAKLKPRKYGDKLDVTSDNKPIAPSVLQIEIVKPKED
jgi:hypothetical protein